MAVVYRMAMRVTAIGIGVLLWVGVAIAGEGADLPAGFERVAAGGRTVIAPADRADDARAALESVQPPELPTTMPADLTARLREHRRAIIDRVAADLLIDDRQPIESFYDDQLIPAIERYNTFAPDIRYLWSPRDRLKAAMKAGWSNPRFYYNRAADEVMIQSQLNLDIDAPAGEILLPALYDADTPPDQRRAVLTTAIQDAERGMARELATAAQLQVHLAFAQFIEQHLADTLAAPDSQWLRLGLAGALGARYASMITGIDAIAFIRVSVAELPRTPVHARGVDLLNPTPEADLREQYIQPYRQAMRRKATAVVFDWITQSDETAVPDTLRKIRDRNPADGNALVEIIRDITGIDLTEKLRPF